jgi:hypothetical protein
MIFSRIVAANLFGLSLLSVSILGCDEEVKKAPAVPSSAPVPAPWHPGRGAEYTFSVLSMTQMGKMPASGRVEVKGKVALVAEALAGGGVRLHLRPSAIELVQPKNVNESVVEELQTDLGRNFAVDLRAGVAEAYLEPEESSLMAFGVRRQLAALAQRVDPKSASATSWKGEEWDSSGLAQIEYAADPAKPGTYRWTKKGYSQVLATRGAESALQEQTWKAEVAASEGTIELDASGVVSIERKEILKTELMPEQFLRSDYEARLRRLTDWREEKAPSVEELERRKVDAPPPKMDTSSLDAIRFSGRSWEEVIATLAENTGSKGQPSKTEFSARQSAYHALVGLLRSDSKNVEKAKTLIDKKDPRSSTVMRTLAAASTSETLGVLASMSLDASRPLAERQGAAAMLLRAENPPPELVETLVQHLKVPEMKEHGLLGLGTFSRRWRIGGHEKAAARAAELIAAQLKSAKTSEEKKLALLAVANSGDGSLFDQAKAFQVSDDPEVREAAIQAVRLMKDKRVEPLLVSLLEKAEAQSEVVTILSALEQRKRVEERTVALVEKRTKPESDAVVRRQAAITLGKWRDQWPRVAKVLETLAKSDPDARVREAAQISAM